MAEELAGFRSAAASVDGDLLGAASSFYLEVLRRFATSKSAVAAFGEVLETRMFLAFVFENEVAMDEGKREYLFHLFHDVLKNNSERQPD